jgi:hypothetical protein
MGKNISGVDMFYLDASNSSANTMFLQTSLQLVSTMAEKIFVVQHVAMLHVVHSVIS